MITEDYCSTRIMLLLGEKGFEMTGNSTYPFAVYWDEANQPHVTHALAMKWLRSKGKFISIYSVEYPNREGHLWAYEVNGEEIADYWFTYEQAVEYALEYCLTKLL